MGHLLRTRFATDIVATFLPPAKPSNKVIILCDGMPGLPGNKRLQELLSRKGYWSFYPRYRGAWESGGEFLAEEPSKDIADVIDALDRPFTSLWDGEEYEIENPKIIIFGMSFGGPAALLNSKNEKVEKVVCISPVVDWREESEDEPLEHLGKIVAASFGQGYRFSKENWSKLGSDEFYNPAGQTGNIDGSKVFIIHAKDDTVVAAPPVEKFAEKIGAKLWMMNKGGHLGSRTMKRWSVRRKIMRFLNT